jgi:methionine-rich copper-binding protein CopC
MKKNNFSPSSAVIILLLVTVIVGSFSSNVYGHASPVSYSPAINSNILQNGSLPTKVVISFSERPEPKASYIHVMDAKNNRIDNNDYAITGQNERQATVTLDNNKFAPGVYTVSWLALSRDDGHITKGSYVFTIKPAQAASAAAQTSLSNKNNTFSDHVTIDNITLQYKISPLYAGISNRFNITLTDASGKSPSNIKNVIMQLNNKQAGIGPIVANLHELENGVYSAEGGYISQPGEWDIKIIVQRDAAYDLNHSFKLTVKAPP